MVIPPVMDWFAQPNPYIGITVAFVDVTCCISFYNEAFIFLTLYGGILWKIYLICYLDNLMKSSTSQVEVTK
ncbi:hypothetical protein PAAL109150_21675 [Paenibacillus alkaliterrae]